MNPSGMMMYYIIRLFLHEVAIHVDLSPEDFRAPYQMGTIRASDGEEVSTQALSESIAECITSSHALLSVFLSMDVNTCRALPVFCWVCVSFAVFILAKLSLSVAHSGSRIGKSLDRSSLKVESFMDRAILHLRNIIGRYRTRIPAIFLVLLFKLRQWCLHLEMIEDESEIASRYQIPAAKWPPQTVTSVEGPRITEHVSKNEKSPLEQITNGNAAHQHVSMNEKLESTDYHHVGELTPDSTATKDGVEGSTATEFSGLATGNIANP